MQKKSRAKHDSKYNGKLRAFALRKMFPNEVLQVQFETATPTGIDQERMVTMRLLPAGLTPSTAESETAIPTWVFPRKFITEAVARLNTDRVGRKTTAEIENRYSKKKTAGLYKFITDKSQSEYTTTVSLEAACLCFARWGSGERAGEHGWKFFWAYHEESSTLVPCQITGRWLGSKDGSSEKGWHRYIHSSHPHNEISVLYGTHGPSSGSQGKDSRSRSDTPDTSSQSTSSSAPVDILLQAQNIVLEGVPGTGKTFELGELSKALRTRWAADERKPKRLDDPPGEGPFDSITFHPATSYEDFVEGIRPLAGSSESTGSLLIDHGTGGQQPPLLLVKKGQKPTIPAATVVTPEWFFQHAESQAEGWGVRDGFFLQICQRALLKPNHAFVVLLDELNRANVPKVMGDLLTTLERSKRAKWTGSAWSLDKATVVKLPVSGRKFFVPENIFVVGTMNTSDRSVTPLDAALRRRFAFFRLEPKLGNDLTEALKSAYPSFDENQKSWVTTLGAYEALQTWLADKLGPDGMLGHSYLFDLLGDLEEHEVSDDNEIEAYHKRTWRYVILPQVITAIEAAGQEDLIPQDQNKAIDGLDESRMPFGLRLRRSARQSFLGSIVID